MKILTSIHFHKIAGITHYVLSLADYIKATYEKEEVELIGVDITRADGGREKSLVNISGEKNWKLYSISIPFENIGDLAKAAGNLGEFESSMESVILEYEKVIAAEKPDIILLSGTYHLVWCLYIAAVRARAKKIVLHYHGVISREVEKYEERARNIYREMEKSYLDDSVFYIFPSNIAREAAEKEVFGRPLKKCKILPNPVPLYFFKNTSKIGELANCPLPELAGRSGINAGFVMRWTHEKNPRFIARLAKFNSSAGGKLNICAVASLNPRSRIYAKLKKDIKFVAPMLNKELARFYRMMDVVICPSHFETYGNIAMEAVACGTPALISPNMGVAEQFRRFGLESFIVGFENTSNVFDKIETAAERRVGRESRAELKRNLGSDVIFKQLLGLLGEL